MPEPLELRGLLGTDTSLERSDDRRLSDGDQCGQVRGPLHSQARRAKGDHAVPDRLSVLSLPLELAPRLGELADLPQPRVEPLPVASLPQSLVEVEVLPEEVGLPRR